MIIIQILGGLGNQMFSYACGRAVADRLKTDLVLDLSSYARYYRKYSLSRFNIIDTKINDVKKTIKIIKYGDIFLQRYFAKHFTYQLNGIKPIFENGSAYNNSIEEVEDNSYLQGYWGSEKYFSNIKEEIRKEFTLREKLSDNSAMWCERIKRETCSVSMHIRRGDYINVAANKNIFESLQNEYYQKAINLIKEKYDISAIFVFSNDILWCKEHLKFDVPVYYVDGNDEDHGHEDLYLMSQCTHNIIANSTFSWWGAWLNNNENKMVICPKRFYKLNDKWHDSTDLCPKEWISIDN